MPPRKRPVKDVDEYGEEPFDFDTLPPVFDSPRRKNTALVVRGADTRVKGRDNQQPALPIDPKDLAQLRADIKAQYVGVIPEPEYYGVIPPQDRQALVGPLQTFLNPHNTDSQKGMMLEQQLLAATAQFRRQLELERHQVLTEVQQLQHRLHAMELQHDHALFHVVHAARTAAAEARAGLERVNVERYGTVRQQQQALYNATLAADDARYRAALPAYRTAWMRADQTKNPAFDRPERGTWSPLWRHQRAQHDYTDDEILAFLRAHPDVADVHLAASGAVMPKR